MVKIIFDTNFLIDLFRYKIDFEEIETLFVEKCEFFTLNLVVSELKSISNSKKTAKRFAKLALELIAEKNFHILKSSQNKVDLAIFDRSQEGYFVATNDANLRKRLKNERVTTIYLRSRKRLAIG